MSRGRGERVDGKREGWRGEMCSRSCATYALVQ